MFIELCQDLSMLIFLLGQCVIIVQKGCLKYRKRKNARISPCVSLQDVIKANSIKPTEIFCQPNKGLLMQTSYSFFESVFQALGIVSFDS